jgi:hypothetical protein
VVCCTLLGSYWIPLYLLGSIGSLYPCLVSHSVSGLDTCIFVFIITIIIITIIITIIIAIIIIIIIAIIIVIYYPCLGLIGSLYPCLGLIGLLYACLADGWAAVPGTAFCSGGPPPSSPQCAEATARLAGLCGREPNYTPFCPRLCTHRSCLPPGVLGMFPLECCLCLSLDGRRGKSSRVDFWDGISQESLLPVK